MKLCRFCFESNEGIVPLQDDDDDSIHSTPLKCACGSDEWLVIGEKVTCKTCNRKPGTKIKYILYRKDSTGIYNTLNEAKERAKADGNPNTLMIAEIKDVCKIIPTVEFKEV